MNTVTDDSDSDDDVPLPYAEVKKTVITMLALPHDAAEGDHTVYIDRADPTTGEISTFALCTLNKKRCPHVRTETMFIDSPVRMHHTGESVVSVTGYDTVEIMGYGAGVDSDDDSDEYDYNKALLGDSDEEDGSEDSDEDNEENSDDESSGDEGEDAPELIGLSIPSASEDDSVLEADVSDSELDVELGDDGSDDDDDSSDSSSSDGDGDGDDDDDDDSSSGDDDGDESMDIASDTDDEDVREAMRLRLKSLSTPQPEGPRKKQKTEAPVAASAPAKVGNPKVPTNETEYCAALRAYIQQHGGKDGSVPLQQLGNSVKRPSAVSRLKKYLEANADKFSVDKKANTVKLAYSLSCCHRC